MNGWTAAPAVTMRWRTYGSISWLSSRVSSSRTPMRWPNALQDPRLQAGLQARRGQQQHVYQFVRGRLQVGQLAQLLERRIGQFLGLVDHQQHALALRVGIHEEGAQRVDHQLAACQFARLQRHAKGVAYGFQQFIGADPG